LVRSLCGQSGSADAYYSNQGKKVDGLHVIAEELQHGMLS
jgi:hypothetical protein